MQSCLIRRYRCAKSVSRYLPLIAAAALSAPALAATYNFIPGAGTTPNASVPGTSGDWSNGANWATGTSAGTVPGASDQASSSSGATTFVTTVVPTINELRFANNSPGTNLNLLSGIQYTANGSATLEIDTGGALTISDTSANGTSGNCQIGNSSPSQGTLIINGGNLTTSAVRTNESLGGLASVIIGSSTNGNAPGNGGPNSTFLMESGGVSVGNNLINGFGANLGTGTLAGVVGVAKGTTIQTGGTVNVAGAVIIGASGFGTYTISAGALNQNGTNGDANAAGRDAIYIGQRTVNASAPAAGGQGTFTQSGTAAVTAANGLYIADQTNTSGIYTVNGGHLAVTGTISVGASMGAGVGTAAAVAATNNVGRFQVNSDAASTATITGTNLMADTANSTLGFGISAADGTTPIALTGAATVTGSTLVDIDPLSGFTPITGEVFVLATAASFTNGTSAVPTLVMDGDAFDHSTLSIVPNPLPGGTGLALIDTIGAVPEPASLSLLALPAIMLVRRRGNRRATAV